MSPRPNSEESVSTNLASNGAELPQNPVPNGKEAPNKRAEEGNNKSVAEKNVPPAAPESTENDCSADISSVESEENDKEARNRNLSSSKCLVVLSSIRSKLSLWTFVACVLSIFKRFSPFGRKKDVDQAKEDEEEEETLIRDHCKEQETGEEECEDIEAIEDTEDIEEIKEDTAQEENCQSVAEQKESRQQEDLKQAKVTEKQTNLSLNEPKSDQKVSIANHTLTDSLKKSPFKSRQSSNDSIAEGEIAEQIVNGRRDSFSTRKKRVSFKEDLVESFPFIEKENIFVAEQVFSPRSESSSLSQALNITESETKTNHSFATGRSLVSEEDEALKSVPESVPRTMATIDNEEIFSSLKDDSEKLFGEHGIPADQLVLLYQLELNAFLKTKLFQCEKYNRIRFTLGPTLYGRRIGLFTNYHPDHSKFNRKTYHPVPIDDESHFLQLCSSGSFHFFYTDVQHKEVAVGGFYIVVKPELSIKNGKETLSVNAIECQTVLSKLMGPLDTWDSKLQVTIQSGYNMIHWTPIQELGSSRSAYSLQNQHKVNPQFGAKVTLDDVSKVIANLQNKHGVLSITDIVLNHTANETPWLKTHPEAAYNCFNSPWLRPAFLLDNLLWHLSLDIMDGRWKDRGVTDEVNQEHHLNTIRSIFMEEYLPLVKLEELYLCDEQKLLEEFEHYLLKYIFGDGYSVKTSKKDLDSVPIKQYPSTPSLDCPPVTLIHDSKYRRFGAKIDFSATILNVFDKVAYVGEFEDRSALTRWIDFALLFVEEKLKALNEHKRNEIRDHLNNAIDNVIKGARYERLDGNGPKVKKISKKHPLATRYFTDDSGHRDLIQIEESLYDADKASFYMAHNGWVMGDDPLRNFAEESSFVYLRRELVCWGDSVKLRYGQKPSDSEFLWNYMEEYVRMMAKTFHGLRLDNCHSTPIHVAQYVIDAARRVNPDLYLIAELFTSSEDVDNIFVNKLGIISLIREALSAPTPFELGRQVYRFGGEPVGSFLPDAVKIAGRKLTNPLFLRPLVPSVAHAIFFDQTHDNESPIDKHTVWDPVASAALVSMTYSAVGSNRGLDELVPHHVHVVNEERVYGSWDKDVKADDGFIRAKSLLNKLHKKLTKNGFSQAFVDQRDRDFVVVTRHNPNNHKSVILMSRTAFYPLDQNYAHHIQPLNIEGKFVKILFELKMVEDKSAKEFVKDPKVINGLKNFRCQVNSNIDGTSSKMVDIFVNDQMNQVHFKDFPPSSVVAISMSLSPKQTESLKEIASNIRAINDPGSELTEVISSLDLLDLNYILFRAEQEERDETGSGCYALSNGPFVYAGLAGIMQTLAKIRTNNDLGHPLCANLRDGDWLLSYIVNRLDKRTSTAGLSKWLRPIFECFESLPRYLIPQYFDSVMLPLYTKLLDRSFSIQSDFIKSGDNFIQRLALGSVALVGTHKPSPLPPLAQEAIPDAYKAKKLLPEELPTMAAGLPHFASGYMRNWGRDTFISVKGLLLITGRYDEAKVLILGFGGTLRHGLIPNLLDGGKNSRFNCRDAVWWWLQAIKDYVTLVPNGLDILQAKVRRVFDNDRVETLQETMIEALQAHFKGIDFIEKNAGTAIDAHMTAEGFHLKVYVDRQTGFVHGGNRWNCGTWMDKMGSSDLAKNRGHPATPRDGAAVEIVGLSASVLIFLSDLAKTGKFPVSGVENGEEKWSFEQWFMKIQANFEKIFFVGDDCQSKVKNRVGVYRDTVGATEDWRDYQLRPNFLIAMVVAPELFQRENALRALKIVQENIQGPLGMKTLDPSDWNYRGDYDNSNQSNDYTIANGFNYHNGPEWLWPTGFYLQARLIFITEHDDEIVQIDHWISKHYNYLVNSDWFGLPELTNSNGQFCRDSCHIQAWSHATLLEYLHLKSVLKKCFI